jgi:hypothetical protein
MFGIEKNTSISEYIDIIAGISLVDLIVFYIVTFFFLSILFKIFSIEFSTIIDIKFNKNILFGFVVVYLIGLFSWLIKFFDMKMGCAILEDGYVNILPYFGFLLSSSLFLWLIKIIWKYILKSGAKKNLEVTNKKMIDLGFNPDKEYYFEGATLDSTASHKITTTKVERNFLLVYIASGLIAFCEINGFLNKALVLILVIWFFWNTKDQIFNKVIKMDLPVTKNRAKK